MAGPPAPGGPVWARTCFIMVKFSLVSGILSSTMDFAKSKLEASIGTFILVRVEERSDIVILVAGEGRTLR